MINKEFLEALRAEMPQLDWRTDAPMSRYTTLRVGGPADCLAEPDSDDEPGALLRLMADYDIPAEAATSPAHCCGWPNASRCRSR